MHEEPIVCTPNDAIRAFLQGRLDALAIGSFIALHPERLRPRPRLSSERAEPCSRCLAIGSTAAPASTGRSRARRSRRRWLQGDSCRELEEAIQKRQDIAHAICVAKARVGIFVAIRALVRPGQKVVLSPYTISDVINMVICAGGIPVFCDLGRDTCNVDPARARAPDRRRHGRGAGDAPARARLRDGSHLGRLSRARRAAGRRRRAGLRRALPRPRASAPSATWASTASASTRT